MNLFKVLTKRNIKLFFKDKGLFFTSLITPMILLVLYATFLGNVYKDSLLSTLPIGITLSERLVDGYVGGQLISSILAVSGVTVAFCSNMLMVQDRANGTIRDLTVSPVKPNVLAVSYYATTLASTLLICFAATAICLLYVAVIGWYLSVADVFFLLLDVFLLVMFGTALSSFINFFLSTQGQISAVGSIISSVYGFICGAYMPISQFPEGLQKALSFLPGTYATSLMRVHALGGVFSEMEKEGLPAEAVDMIRKTVDCEILFFDTPVPLWVKYAVLVGAVILFLAGYILLHTFFRKKR
ncbi:MAG: ABC transporter permease [Clostridia bacterium]|nr:ABC transporter permease [Clostridia bacterium]